MVSIPKTPEEVFPAFIEDCRKSFGNDLVSIVLYGSAARGEYIPKRSDINFLIALTENGMDNLGRAFPLVRRWHKANVSTPLFLSTESLSTSLDVFPIEFLTMKAAYRVIHGADVLAGLSFDKFHVRLQCEREAKGKLLQLRENFINTEGKKQAIESLIAVSLPTFFSLFQAIRFLKDLEPVLTGEGLIASAGKDCGLDQDLFLQLLSIRRKQRKLKSEESLSLMEHYIREVKKLSVYVDQMTV